MTTNEGLDKAIYWSQRMDWAVFPVNPYSKAPSITDPFQKASREITEICELFKGRPRTAYGIPCGPQNGITVVDIDRKNNVDGLANFFQLGIEIPTTAVISTPSAGYHMYFHTGDLRVPNSVGKIASGIDVRGHGGYVLGPDSLIPRGQYIWETKFFPISKNLAPMPKKLIELASLKDPKTTSVYRSKSSVGGVLLDSISEGQRNTLMASRIGYLLKKMDADRAWKAAKHINENCCKPPLPKRELERTFCSILKRDARYG